jgi:hypothetical protein
MCPDLGRQGIRRTYSASRYKRLASQPGPQPRGDANCGGQIVQHASRQLGRWVVEIGMQVNRAISVRECSSPSVTDADVLRTANEPNTGQDMQGFGTQLDSRANLTTTAGVLSSTAVFIIASDPCVGKWSPELDRGLSLPCASVLPPRPLRRCGNMSRRRLSRTIYQALDIHPNEAGRRPPVSSDEGDVSA